ncbi:oligoribonuclease [Bacillus tianshenii]|uniref:DHH family phosphoesterase n=1 Tax=Sutcliffiella tianshenii TaxID=1463404 RepID=UPI001CD7A254|nr:DHH family phosphoesterase [Bacillus tianshenii]MCA1319514.1 oligoribonuclease [Bacillus tianshenii]
MIHLFTHNDLDGVGCGILAKIAFKEKVEVHYNSVGSLNYQVANYLEHAIPNNTIYITDLSVHEENAKKLDSLNKAGGKVQFIDHHKTALTLNDYEWAFVQVEYEDGRLTSATSLFYEYLQNHQLLERTEAVHEFVELVRQYDTWEWDRNNNTKAKRLNDLLYMMSIVEFEARMLAKLEDSTDFRFDDLEDQLLNMEEKKMEKYLRRKKRELVQKQVGDKWAGIVYAESFLSELGNALGKENPHLDYIAMINMGSKRISLRTIHDDVDVSEVAGKFEGGGHAKASGCNLNEAAYKLYVAESFPLEPLKADADKNVFNVKESPNGVLYESKSKGILFLIPRENGSWEIENNEQLLDKSFQTFQEAETYIKRNFAAWLVKDEEYVTFLVENIRRLRSS